MRRINPVVRRVARNPALSCNSVGGMDALAGPRTRSQTRYRFSHLAAKQLDAATQDDTDVAEYARLSGIEHRIAPLRL